MKKERLAELKARANLDSDPSWVDLDKFANLVERETLKEIEEKFQAALDKAKRAARTGEITWEKCCGYVHAAMDMNTAILSIKETEAVIQKPLQPFKFELFQEVEFLSTKQKVLDRARSECGENLYMITGHSHALVEEKYLMDPLEIANAIREIYNSKARKK